MKEKKNKKIPEFREIWTHIPTPKRHSELGTVSDWVKNIMDQVDGTERNILVVDDEQEVLNSLKQILEHEGFNVDVATNGIEALDKLSRTNFNLILSDIRMPAINGIELSEICKNHPQLNRIPIILFSGYYDTFESCADYFLAKPIESKSLLNVIKKIFKRYQTTKGIEKISEIRKKLKYFQVISIEKIADLSQLQKILDFIWVFQPKHIPIFKMSHEANLSIDQIRELLNIIEKQDTLLIVEESPVLRALLEAELIFLGGNPSRIFDTLENVKKNFEI